MTSPNVLIIGSTSFLGSRLALGLHNTGYQVTLRDDLINLPLEPMTWYRRDKLVEKGLIPKYVNFTDDEVVKSLIGEHREGVIIYVPSLLFDGKSEENVLYNYLKSSQLLVNFIILLEEAKSYSLKFLFLTLQDNKLPSIQKALLKTFELSLYYYEHSNKFSTATLELDGIYGPWQGKGSGFAYHPLTDKLFIDDIIERITVSLKCSELHCTEVLRNDISIDMITTNPDNIIKTQKWISEYSTFLQLPKKNVIMSSYFTISKNVPNKSYYILPNLFQFFEAWFLTGKQFGVHFVIFHDSLKEQFQNNLIKLYPGHVEFVKVNSLHGRSTNDARFYEEYAYLLSHPEINKVLLTDCRDVIFLKDPFKVMDVIGDYLYMGIDKPFYRSLVGSGWGNKVIKPCHRSEINSDAANRYPLHNAGVIGGTRHVMLAYLTLLIHYFDKTPHNINCNMGTTGLVTEKHFSNDYFSGYPFQAVTELSLAIPQGLAIRHKRTGEV